MPFTVAAWAATTIAAAAVITIALGTLVPLLVLVAGFEAVYALHTNVERIGRYLQVFHEPHGGWEHVAMEFGKRLRSGPDPLFGRLFSTAVSVNFLPAVLSGTAIELAILAAVHLVVLNRIRQARTGSARQRDADLEMFRAISES